MSANLLHQNYSKDYKRLISMINEKIVGTGHLHIERKGKCVKP